MSELKRYQNPEVFERLAMEYAIGAMHGRVRKRFEALMERHFYLRAVTEAYENYFASLNEFLPEQKPSDRVWKGIEQELKAEFSAAPAKEYQRSSSLFAWWHSLGAKVASAVASLFLMFGVGFSLVTSSSVGAYMSVLESMDDQQPKVMAMAKKGQGISLKFMEQTEMPDNMTMVLWCIPKEGGSPVSIGEVPSGKEAVIVIDKSTWQGLDEVGQLAITIENREAMESTPKGEMKYKGKLMPMMDDE